MTTTRLEADTMTETTNWTALTPPQVDEILAAASLDAEKAQLRIAHALESIHRYVGDAQEVWYVGRQRRTRWAMSHTAVVEAARAGAPDATDTYAAKYQLPGALERFDDATSAFKAASATIEAGNEEFSRRGGWSRFFLVTGGHIHSSMNCSTCNKNGALTSFGWLPSLSGLTEADAVKEHGAILCTVCFPSAPVEWTNQHELDAAAKAASQCPGAGTWDWEKAAKDAGKKPQYGRRYQTCPHCNQLISITSRGKLRAHKPKAG